MTPNESIPAITAFKGSLLRKQLLLVIIFAVLTLASLALPMSELSIPMQHFLPLHTVLEFVTIAVAILVFSTVWHTPTKLTSGTLIVIGMSLFGAAWLDAFHALSYKGMPDFITPSSVEKAIDFWLAARYVAAAGLLLASVRPTLPPVSVLVRYGALGIFTLVNLVVAWLIVAHEADLPHTFIEGVGVTPFKTQLEWVIFGMMALAAWRYYRLARASDDDFLPLMFSAAAVGAMGETYFTQYHMVSDFQHVMGHSFKLVSYLLIYQAMFIVSVRLPFKQLEQRKQALLQANNPISGS